MLLNIYGFRPLTSHAHPPSRLEPIYNSGIILLKISLHLSLAAKKSMVA